MLLQTGEYEIGLTYVNYIYSDDDERIFPFDDKEMLTNYIVDFVRLCKRARMLYTTSKRHEGYIAITTLNTNLFK